MVAWIRHIEEHRPIGTFLNNEQKAKAKQAEDGVCYGELLCSNPHTDAQHHGKYVTASNRSWQSQQYRLKREYDRVRRIVNLIAPEQFKDSAKPTGERCNIVPTTFEEYRAHKEAMNQDRLNGLEASLAYCRTEIMLKERGHKPIRSVFGINAKVYETGLSPVLALPTVWSLEYKHLGIPFANWPIQSELQHNGDNRIHCQTHWGRYLPPPRFPNAAEDDGRHLPLLPVMSLDMTGPIYPSGPFPIEVEQGNQILDVDGDFEVLGSQLLGSELTAIIGEW